MNFEEGNLWGSFEVNRTRPIRFQFLILHVIATVRGWGVRLCLQQIRRTAGWQRACWPVWRVVSARRGVGHKHELKAKAHIPAFHSWSASRLHLPLIVGAEEKKSVVPSHGGPDSKHKSQTLLIESHKAARLTDGDLDVAVVCFCFYSLRITSCCRKLTFKPQRKSSLEKR